MIVICACGIKLRVALANAASMRCPKCKRMMLAEIDRQAERNAKAVLEIASYLASTPEQYWTPEQEVVARILHAHEHPSKKG